VGWLKNVTKKLKKNENGGFWRPRARHAGTSGRWQVSVGALGPGGRDDLVRAGKSTLTVDFQSQIANHGGQEQKQAAWAEWNVTGNKHLSTRRRKPVSLVVMATPSDSG